MYVLPNKSLPAKTSLEQLEYLYQLSTVKVNVVFAICAKLLRKKFPNVEPIVSVERPTVSPLARRARLFALGVEFSKSFSLFC